MKGKFKERIDQQSDMNQCDAFDVGCDKIDPDEMVKMIDEARKEIWRDLNYLFGDATANFTPSRMAEDVKRVLKRDTERAKETFVKWFGSDKNK